MNSAEKKFLALKEKAKYMLAVSSLQEADPMGKQGGKIEPLVMPSTHEKHGLKKVFHFLKDAVPSYILYNPLTGIIFRTASKLIDYRVSSLLKQQRLTWELLNEDVPASFSLPDVKEPKVSIIIPVHNKYEYTHKAVYAISRFCDAISYEVIIADDASSDETKDIESRIINVAVVRNVPALGFVKNCNNAAKEARGEYIVLLNNDTVIQPGWLESMIHVFEHDHTIGVTGSRLIYPSGVLQEAGGVVFRDGSCWNYGKLGDPSLPEFNYLKEVDYVSGASLMIKTETWKQVGGFDEQFAPAYYEDTDLAFNVRQLGLKVIYQPASVVIHFEGISHGTDLQSGVKQHQVVNQEKFVNKWGEVLRKEQAAGEDELFKGRDRSLGKKTVLFIDHYVPEFDKDAGSRTCFQYLKLMVELGYNIKFIGDDFMKREPYTSVLEQMGIEVLYGYSYQSGWQQWISQNRKFIDYYFLNRPGVSIKYIDFIRKETDGKIIYFGHDLHFLRTRRQYELTGDEDVLKESEHWRKTEAHIFECADVVLYPSTAETAIVKSEFRGSSPEVLPLNIYQKSTGSALREFFEGKSGLLFVGGFNHEPNKDAVLWFANEIFPLIRKELPGIRLVVVGSNVPSDVQNLSSEDIIIKGYVSDEDLRLLYAETRIVIAPLRFGAGVKGKIIEALWYRCAVVTTSTGAEGIASDGELLTVADNATEFASAVVGLYQDTQRLKFIFNHAPSFIESHFSKSSAVELLKKHLPLTS